jgi:hypothetical protein
MEVGKVIFFPSFLDEMEYLAFVLFKENYFSFQSNADFYVDEVFDFIENNLDTFPHKSTPEMLGHLGSNYIFYKSIVRTTWFVFFEKLEENYFISGILNNHCEEAQFM